MKKKSSDKKRQNLKKKLELELKKWKKIFIVTKQKNLHCKKSHLKKTKKTTWLLK